MSFYSFIKKTILLNQKKVCFHLFIKKDFFTRTYLYITENKSFLQFC